MQGFSDPQKVGQKSGCLRVRLEERLGKPMGFIPTLSQMLIDLLMGLFRGAVFRHGWGARKQPIKQPTGMPTSTMALMGRFLSLMGRFPTLMGCFTNSVLRGRFASWKSTGNKPFLKKRGIKRFLTKPIGRAHTIREQPSPKDPAVLQILHRSKFTLRSKFAIAQWFAMATPPAQTQFSWVLQAFSPPNRGSQRSETGGGSKNTTAE